MRERLRAHAVAGLLGVVLSSAVAAQELPFSHVTTEHRGTPLLLSNLQTIHQDRLGFIWIGFYGSVLARSDGHEVERYTPADGVPEFTVREIVEGRDGRLWIGSDSGVAVSDRPLQDYPPGARVRFVSRAGGVDLVQTRIRQNGIVCDAEGRIWVGTQGDGVYRYHFEGNRLQVARFSTATGPRNIPVVALGARRDGSVWASLNVGTVLVLPERRSLMPPCTTSAFHEGRSGTFWGGCMDGRIWRSGDAFQLLPEGANAQITAIHETASDLWITSHGAGVLRVQGNALKSYSLREGMPGSVAWDILEDREGNLWFAQEGGLSRLHFDYPAFLAYRRSLAEESVLTVLPRRDGSDVLWIGTTGGLTAIRGEESVSFDVSHGLYSSAIYSLMRDARGRVWVGTSRGLHAIVDDPSLAPPTSIAVNPITVLDRTAYLCTIPLDNNPVYAAKQINLQNVETLWFASPGGLRCLIGNQWYAFSADAGLSPTGATSVDADATGRIWVGTSDRGVLRTEAALTAEGIERLPTRPLLADGGQVEVTVPIFASFWNTSRGAPTNAIRNILSVDNEIWIGTARGLAVFRAQPPALAAVLGTREGLGGDLIAGVARSPRTGRIWVSQNNGLAEIDPRNRRVLRVVRKEDGLVDGEAWGYGSVVADQDGAVFLATAKGLTRYRPDLDTASRLAPLLRLRKIALQQNNIGGNRVEIAFASMTFAADREVVYRTRLVGDDDRWSAPSSTPEVRYANLPAYFVPKRYRFEVVATNRSGLSSAPAAYEFSIVPAWWFRWWAFLIYLVVLGVLIDVINRWRTSRLEAHNRELTEKVAAQTAELRAKAAELETLLRELEARNREVQEATQAKSMFLASMSHELRTPMNAIIGFSAILIERLEKTADPKHLNFLHMINAAGEHLLTIINEILDLSKVEAGKMQFFPEPFLVRDAVESTCLVMKGVALTQGVSFDIDIPDDLPLLESDPSKFKQILYNLLSNAVKFSPPNSTVTISARPAGSSIAVSVIDHGAGIEEENLGRIFDEFRQVGANTRAQKGTGLGLALVKKFVEAQGGTITVRSAPGRGSTFTVTMPIRYHGVSAPAAAEEIPEGERVLLVEDDTNDYVVARDAIESAGFIPVRARRGDEAIKLARTAHPVAITLDVVLPDTDGWEVLKSLKNDPATCDIPVLIISRADTRDLGFALGADEYFVKPLDAERLKRKLQRLVTKGS